MNETTFGFVFKFPLITAYLFGVLFVSIGVVILEGIGWGIISLGIGFIFGAFLKFLNDLGS